MKMGGADPNMSGASKAVSDAFNGVLGYLNFSSGKPDARFAFQVSECCRCISDDGEPVSLQGVQRRLGGRLKELQLAGNDAFKCAAQAEAVLHLAFEKVIPAYQQHHADLLAHLGDEDFCQPFFLAKIFETILQEGPAWKGEAPDIRSILERLNDYVGYRPIPILETRPGAEPYDHERLRAVPIYLRGAGVAWGKFERLVRVALEILIGTEPGLLQEACLELDHLEELALDPRAYDQSHPVNRRSNYIFGEWDPNCLDHKGHYQRFIVRPIVLQTLMQRVQQVDESEQGELLFEAAAILVGTMLMAAGVSGSWPGHFDSSTSLSTLRPRIARVRDRFYDRLLMAQDGARRERLEEERRRTGQPFGAGRQHLNEELARMRARQLVHARLSILYARLGFAEASDVEAQAIRSASQRIHTGIWSRLAAALGLASRGMLNEAIALMAKSEALLRRGISCGAIVDPWNILAFQGLYPLSAAREDSIQDPRVHELLAMISGMFRLFQTIIGEASLQADRASEKQASRALKQLAAWWDRFATTSVHGLPVVNGEATVRSCDAISAALKQWQQNGQNRADLRFWRGQLHLFSTSEVFRTVVRLLLQKKDLVAALGLLMAWLGTPDGPECPLDDGSLETLLCDWLLECGRRAASSMSHLALGKSGTGAGGDVKPVQTLMQKFFDQLEANAGEYWDVPGVERHHMIEKERDESIDNPYHAAFEGVTYRDSADDNHEGTVIGDDTRDGRFVLESEGQRLQRRLRFLGTVARLWELAGAIVFRISAENKHDGVAVGAWLARAETNQRNLQALLQQITDEQIPEPLGGFESMVEYDRRQALKEAVVELTIATSMQAQSAIEMLRLVSDGAEGRGARAQVGKDIAPVKLASRALRRSVWAGDRKAVAGQTRQLLDAIAREPLLYARPAAGRSIVETYRARRNLQTLRWLAVNLPRIGAIPETFCLLEKAHETEKSQDVGAPAISEFAPLFRAGWTAVVWSVVTVPAELGGTDDRVVQLLQEHMGPFLGLWRRHAEHVRLSSLEALRTQEEWHEVAEFIRTYGDDLFHVRTLTLAHLRAVEQRGIPQYLDDLLTNPDPLHPIRLVEDIDRGFSAAKASTLLGTVVRCLIENYDIYKDYNLSTAKSDYGSNLFILFEFLRLKAAYDRQQWQLFPALDAAVILSEQGRNQAASDWHRFCEAASSEAADVFLAELSALEARHGLRLLTIRQHLQERFTKPLLAQRATALIGAVMVESRVGTQGESWSAFRSLVHEYSEINTGSGLEAPAWIENMYRELFRRERMGPEDTPTWEEFVLVPRRQLRLEELESPTGGTTPGPA